MTPDHAEQVHRTRARLARLACEHGWQVTQPNSDWSHVFMHAYRQTCGSDAARIGIDWADDLPTGCRLIITTQGRTIHTNVPSVRMLERAFTNTAWLVAAVALAEDSPIIDLRDEAA